MSLNMGMGMGQGQRMDMRPSPSLIQFTEILQLSGTELQTVIEQAVAENPALELAELDLCRACGDPLLPDGSCLRCRRGEDLAGAAAGELFEPDSESEERDFITHIADQRNLHEHLLIELAVVLDPEDMPIAEYLVGELDDRGFLETPLDLAARSLDVPLERVEHVLAVLQSVGPLGLGARSVEECLRIQLDGWEEAGVTCPLARTLATGHLEALGRGQYSQLARQIGVSHDDIIVARDFIRTHLRPYPIADESAIGPWERQEEGTSFIAPDVVIRPSTGQAGEGGFVIEIIESRRYRLSINPIYRDLVGRIETGAATGPGLSAKEGAHIQAQVNQARQFLGHIHDRRETMRRVTAYVMTRQLDFLRHGPRHLLPLTRAEVAEALSLHESTVSRATAGKYVLLPSRQIVPYSTFFKAALSVQDVLRELVADEPRPLTDTELAQALADRGYPIARRTVAKYREQMGILPSSLR
jgi:RNA polymerase sigma-54 factor